VKGGFFVLPILHIEDNLVFDTSGQAYAVFKVTSEPYAHQPKHIQQQIIDRVRRGLSGGISGEFWIYLLAQQWSVEQVLRSMNNLSTHEVWKDHQTEVRERLQKFLPFNRVNLIVFPLGFQRINLVLSGDNWKDWLRQAKEGLNTVKNRFIKQEIIGFDRIEAAKRQAEEWRVKLGGLGRIQKAKLREIEWWLKRSYFRGLPDPKGSLPDPLPAQIMTQGRQNYIRPNRAIYLTLSDVISQEKAYQLIFEHAGGQKSHQTFFATVNVPQPIPEEDPTGYEWIYGIAEQLPFPVDIALHVRVETHQQALENLKGKKKTAQAQYEEWQENEEDIPLELEEDMATVGILEKKLRGRQPLVHVKTIFALGASKPEILKSQIESFKGTAGSYHALVQAPGDMKKMFQAFYPFGEELPVTWETPMDPGVLAASVPFGSKTLGDPFGFLLGRLSNERPVWMDPRRPAQVLNTTSAIMLAGTLGSGKTVTLKELAIMLLSWGAKGFLIDPKGDTDILAELPFDIKILRFTVDSHTQFSPFRIGNIQDARGIIDLLFNPRGDELRQIVLNTAIERVLKGQFWDMQAFSDALKELREHATESDIRDQARLIFEHVRLMRDHELGRIFFGEDTGESNFNHDFIIAIVRGLNLPDQRVEKEKWTENERYAAAIMYAVATLGLRRLMNLPQNVVKVLGLDEAWIYRRFEQGQRLINDALRFSRSENLIPIMASQNATDFLPRSEEEEDFTGLFAWKFMLHLESTEQVKAALQIMGMTDVNPREWEKRFNNYRDGYGLVKDPEGRIGEMQVDVVPGWLLEYFDTTPGEENEE
jgi:hypothetical protein